MTDMIWSFSPWLVFLAVNRVTSLYWAVAAGGVAALIVLARAISRHKVHLFDVVGVVYFAAVGGMLAVAQPHNIGTWARYAQAGSHGSLTIIVFVSILMGRPFTESYARDRTPEHVWASPAFHSFNRQISIVWGLAFFIGTISMVVAGSVDSGQFLLRIVVPFGALFGAYSYTQKQSSSVTSAR